MTVVDNKNIKHDCHIYDENSSLIWACAMQSFVRNLLFTLMAIPSFDEERQDGAGIGTPRSAPL